ncbi:hypothetical protein PTNB85_09947 [Pyrenophora teres f. teres]|nr:hypothetical protein PTNB85_09947 [Pyrenophora teres f. teres]KAE8852488.1 hypothetical protein PTNB29_10389 [Pyrenophora teres f. teres]
MATPSTAIKSTSRSKSLLCRTNNTGLHTAKPGAEDQGDWELVDKKAVLDDQDKAEWVLVGKTEAETELPTSKSSCSSKLDANC